MAIEIEDGMEVLPITECEALLQRGGIGFLAMSGVDSPVLRPVNFAYHEGALIMRTGEGRILEAAQVAEPASFAISQIEGFEHAGWSVVVVGKLAERSSAGEIADLPLRPWVSAEKHHFVGLSIDEISGRRIAGRGVSA